jgi:ribulose-phosphate 3-epimerase
MPLVAPSILAGRLAYIAEEIDLIERAGADWVHVDIMDGHFVPNLTMGPDIAKAIKRLTKLPLDVHLMVENPERFIAPFAEAEPSYISVHQEVLENPERVFRLIEDKKCKPAVVINPKTPVETVLHWVERLAMVLVMSVEPGFAGQPFIESVLPKLTRLREHREKTGSACLLEIDGGIDVRTAARAVAAGADVLVSGSGVFRSKDYAEAIARMKNPG